MTGSVREVVQRALERDGAIALPRSRVHVVAPVVLETWAKAEVAD